MAVLISLKESTSFNLSKFVTSTSAIFASYNRSTWLSQHVTHWLVRLSPNVLWAQTEDAVLVTVELPQEGTAINLDDTSLKISGKKNGNDYDCCIQFYKPIKASEALKANDRFLRFKLPKNESEKWPSLNSDGKKHWIKIDWDRWIDSDAEDNDNVFQDDFEMPNFGPFGKMGMPGMGGMPGMPGMDMGGDLMPEEGDDCCNQGDCACDACDCGSVCKCGADCQCNDCSCVAECNCDAACLGDGHDKEEPKAGGCHCCDNCTCGDNCQCTPENKCGDACKCGV
ncbi:hypothetical protein BaOVIS_004930 [Babesia ovis]|uniref:CS domain-containing protein n=1 Tax=Babesia ovis TaxID=5869 RepID=A0A9W5T821_BABOV|nr:hypothetical protein BaOVIS_004930 [Babesia ovis]